MILEKDWLNALKWEESDVRHYKIVDEPILKKDCIALDHFLERLEDPDSFNKTPSLIEHEIRVCYLTVEAPTDEFPTALYEGEQISDFNIRETQMFFSGEYDEEMKQRINEYLNNKGFDSLRRTESISSHKKGYRFHPYTCMVYRTVEEEGFYLERAGVLRGGYGEKLWGEMFSDMELKMNRTDFEALRGYLDKDFITHQFGVSAWNRLIRHYEKNFLENFEPGRSFMGVDFYQMED